MAMEDVMPPVHARLPPPGCDRRNYSGAPIYRRRAPTSYFAAFNMAASSVPALPWSRPTHGPAVILSSDPPSLFVLRQIHT